MQVKAFSVLLIALSLGSEQASTVLAQVSVEECVTSERDAYSFASQNQHESVFGLMIM